MADMPTIERHRGDTFANDLFIKKSDGSALNVTGFTIVMTVDRRKEPSDGTTQLFQLTATIVDGAAGHIRFQPNGTQANAAPGTYYYDVQMTDTSMAVKTVGPGKYIFKQDISK